MSLYLVRPSVSKTSLRTRIECHPGFTGSRSRLLIQDLSVLRSAKGPPQPKYLWRSPGCLSHMFLKQGSSVNLQQRSFCFHPLTPILLHWACQPHSLDRTGLQDTAVTSVAVLAGHSCLLTVDASSTGKPWPCQQRVEFSLSSFRSLPIQGSYLTLSLWTKRFHLELLSASHSHTLGGMWVCGALSDGKDTT